MRSLARQVPTVGEMVKVEAIFPSYSTLLIISVPLQIWDMLPDHPACSFVGYTSGPNIGGASKTLPAANFAAADTSGQTSQDGHQKFDITLRKGRTEQPRSLPPVHKTNIATDKSRQGPVNTTRALAKNEATPKIGSASRNEDGRTKRQPCINCK